MVRLDPIALKRSKKLPAPQLEDLVRICKIPENHPVTSCKYCNSKRITKYGMRNKKQLYLCKNCERRFVGYNNYENTKLNKNTIFVVMNLYCAGYSSRTISCFLLNNDLKVSHCTISNWVRDYVKYISKNNLRYDTVNEQWHISMEGAMEISIKIKKRYRKSLLQKHSIKEEAKPDLLKIVEKSVSCTHCGWAGEYVDNCPDCGKLLQ